MSKPLGSMYIELGLEHSQFQSNLNAAKRAVNYFSAEARKLDAQMKASGQSVEALGAKHKSLKQAITAQQDVLKRLKTSFDELKPGTPQWEKAAVEIERHNAKLAAMESQLGQVEAAMRKVHAENSKWGQASAKLEAFGDKMISAGNRVKAFGDATQTVGNALTKGVTAPLLAGAGMAVKSAIQFESAFAGVKKTVDETATVSYTKLSRGIRDMSKELPASAAEIANVAEAAGQLGVPAGAILGFTRNMINLGESTNMSSEEAAMSIAKIGNIMGATGDQLSDFSTQFGATVVRLGNNFATTESDVTAMTNRLAAAGRIAGLSTPEIMGLATSMSAVGIEAEAGGTAMSQTLTKISEAVSESGEELQIYADTAGMSAEEFATAWREKPAKAIEAFIKGLGQSEAKGKDVNKVLDDLGLTGIRQSNMLKSLGLSAESMGDAMKMASDEWAGSLGKTNALTEEAGKRYETTESKLKMLRNEATDVAIEFGGPLVDALRDGLEAIKPFIEKAAEMAKAFSEMDEEQQRQIITLGLMAAGIGPVLSMIGKTTSGIGSMMTMIGSSSKALGEFAGWVAKLGAGKTSIDAIGTAATGASTSTGLLTSAVGLLGNPVTWGVLLGGAALIALGHFGQKALEAKQRTAEWGTEVSKAEAEALSGFKSKVDETTKAMEGFSSHSVDGVAKVKEAFQDLVSEIETLTNKELAKDIELAKKWGLSDEHIQNLKDRAGQTVENVQRMSDEVVNIYKNAKENNRQLSAEEKEIVLNNQTELINKQLELMKYSAEERKAIQKAMNGDFDELNKEQLAKAREATVQWAKEENEVYKQKQAELNELLADGAISKAEHYEMMKSLDAEHAAAMEAYQDRFVKIQAKLIEGIKTPDGGKSLFQAIKKDMEELGFSFEEFENHMRGMADTAAQTSGLTAKSMADMSDEMSAANLAWNGMVLDTKTGEIKTNAQEEVNKALAAEGGWDSMQFILKEANLASNARLMIAEALVANGQWEGLSPSEKQLVVRGQEAIAGIAESKEHLAIWNSMPTEVKKLLGENTAFMSSADGAKQALERWNLMTPTQKELTATNLTEGGVQLAQGTIDSLMGKSVGLAAIDEASPTVSMAQLVVDSLKQTQPASLQAVDNTGPASASATASLNAPKQGAPAPIHATDLTGPVSASATASLNAPKQGAPAPIHATDLTGPVSASANASVNSPRQNSPVQLHATNQTGPQVGAATSAVNSVTQTRVPGITALDHTAGGVNSARANVNSVQDRTVTITSIFRSIGKAIGFEKGTNYHRGGLAVVNDQKGSLYKELVTLPNGKSFIPEGRDVLIDLPRGSKVLPANKTRSLMAQLKIPRYADGVGIPENSRLLQDLNRVTPQVQVVGRGGLDGSREVISLLKELIELTKGNAALMPEVLNVVVKLGNLTLDEFSQEIGKRLDKQERLRRLTSSY